MRKRFGEIRAKRNQQQKSAFICTMICDSCTTCPPVASPSLVVIAVCSVPAEGDVTGSVASLLHQGFVKLSSGTRVDGRPAVLAVVLQTGDVGAEERCKLAAAASPLALITQLVIQYVWLHFHLQPEVRGII